MKAERYRQAKQAFLAVLARSPEERDAALEENCGHDTELRTEVAALLAADGAASSFVIGGALAEAVFDEDATRRIGMRIGNSLLKRVVGAGGMGLVYEAEQERPRRLVAIKIMRRGLVTSEILRRFEWEVEALGRLHHPNIAQVYETGTFEEDGDLLPYFAMEYIADSCTLSQWVVKQKLGRRGRMELFATICEAVHHGHQKGIIHRDLKPANVLVDGEGRPKVIDFGVARATRSDIALTTLQTRTGELLGTLQYMSPEQCDADPLAVDVRADVYSLGVMLYELLCGQLPYSLEGLSIATAVHRIRESIPPMPSSLRRELRGDPESIVLKALEKEREQRYESAEQLARDLRNHLAGEPILARSPSLLRRAIRSAARHPLATTAFLCLAIVAIASVSMVLGARMVLAAPDSVSIDADLSKVRLLSRAGVSLAEWEVGPSGAVVLAEMIERPLEFGGGEVVVIGAADNDVWPHSGEASVFSLDDPERPLWTTAEHTIVQPSSESHRPEARFVAHIAFLEDVLEESAGKELVVVHRLSMYSAETIRVFDLSGKLRYQAWNDGAIFDACWLSGARRLVVAALDSEKRWDQVGFSFEGSTARYPVIFFALEPKDGRVGDNEWIVRSGQRLDETLSWYYWLGPMEHIAVLQDAQGAFSGQAMSLDRSQHVRLVVLGGQSKERPARPGLWYVLDGKGHLVARYPDDAYSRWKDAGLLPPFSSFQLLPYEQMPR